MTGLFEHEGVLFDMDGVLLNSEPLYTIAYNRVMEPWGKTLDPVTKHEIMGRPPSKSIPHVIAKFGLPIGWEEFKARRDPIMDELIRNVEAMPGAHALIRELKLRGIRIAVATSTFRPLFERKTKSHPWFSLFDAVICGDDPEIEHPKPAPDIFLVAARRLGVRIERCGVFEDSPAGLEAARATGAGAVYPVTHEQAITELLAQHGIVQESDSGDPSS